MRSKILIRMGDGELVSMSSEEIKEDIVTATQDAAQRAEIPELTADEIEQLLEIMKRTLQDGEDLLISGFGKFVVKEKKARRGRNPQTRQDLQLRARRVVVFKTSGILRQKINS